ncbi:MAG TPA: hypothetical protein VI643_07570 [Planctomycetota bacterium]|nr:hypothetical protein [Planctomycetota bacterium]
MAIRRALGLHFQTWVVLLVVAVALGLQQYIIGPYYWTGAALLINLLYGFVILAAVGVLVEWRIRAAGVLLHLDQSTWIALLVAFGVIWLANLIPQVPGCTGGSDIRMVSYGFPGPVVGHVQQVKEFPDGRLIVVSDYWSVDAQNVWVVLATAAAVLVVVGLIWQGIVVGIIRAAEGFD